MSAAAEFISKLKSMNDESRIVYGTGFILGAFDYFVSKKMYKTCEMILDYSCDRFSEIHTQYICCLVALSGQTWNKADMHNKIVYHARQELCKRVGEEKADEMIRAVDA